MAGGQRTVLRMHVVRASGVDYYVRDLIDDALGEGSSGRSRVAGESPGEWLGGGVSALGLAGRVGAPDFAEVLGGRDPWGDRSLRADRGARSVAGVDLVCCAPKSVSLLHLLAPGELAEAAGAAHATAVEDMVGYLDRQAIGVRRVGGGTTRLLGSTGAVAAGFVHRTSRALDPHLHTHLVTANVAQGADGLWSSLDSRRLFHHRRALQAVYDSSLRADLTRRAGVSWERGRTGGWDVVGVDPVLARVYSQRAAGMDERRASRQASPTGRWGTVRSRRAAFHADRPEKDRVVTSDELRERWRRRALDHGLDVHELISVVGRERDAPSGTAGRLDRSTVAESLAAVVGKRHTVTDRDLVAAVAESAGPGLCGKDVEWEANALAHVVGQVPGRGVTGIRGAGHPERDGRWEKVDVDAAIAVHRFAEDGPGRCPPGRVDHRPSVDRPSVDDRNSVGLVIGVPPVGRGLGDGATDSIRGR